MYRYTKSSTLIRGASLYTGYTPRGAYICLFRVGTSNQGVVDRWMDGTILRVNVVVSRDKTGNIAV